LAVKALAWLKRAMALRKVRGFILEFGNASRVVNEQNERLLVVYREGYGLLKRFLGLSACYQSQEWTWILASYLVRPYWENDNNTAGIKSPTPSSSINWSQRMYYTLTSSSIIGMEILLESLVR
jgi:hypothetical protein